MFEGVIKEVGSVPGFSYLFIVNIKSEYITLEPARVIQ